MSVADLLVLPAVEGALLEQFAEGCAVTARRLESRQQGDRTALRDAGSSGLVRLAVLNCSVRRGVIGGS